MQETLDRFAAEVRRRRKKMHYTQKQLADKLCMNQRTIIDIENGNTVPRFDTVIYIAKELNISLDPLLFPDSISASVSKDVSDFFCGRSKAEVQKYISLCQGAEAIHSDKVEVGV